MGPPGACHTPGAASPQTAGLRPACGGRTGRTGQEGERDPYHLLLRPGSWDAPPGPPGTDPSPIFHLPPSLQKNTCLLGPPRVPENIFKQRSKKMRGQGWVGPQGLAEGQSGWTTRGDAPPGHVGTPPLASGVRPGAQVTMRRLGRLQSLRSWVPGGHLSLYLSAASSRVLKTAATSENAAGPLGLSVVTGAGGVRPGWRGRECLVLLSLSVTGRLGAPAASCHHARHGTCL